MSSKLTRHHLKAKRYGGKNNRDNIVKLPENFHQAYHQLFGTLSPESALTFFMTVFMSGRRRWTKSELLALRRRYEGM